MQQLRFDSRIGAHCQRECSLRLGQAPGALDQLTAQGAELLEAPQWRTPFRGIPFLLIAEHLHFPVEVMRQHGREQVDLIAGFSAGRNIVHLGLRLEFGKDAFLRAASIVEAQRLFGRDVFVGNDHLEVIAVFVGDKQVQLDRAFVLLSVLVSDKYEAVAIIPTRGFPVRFEEAALSVEVTPALAVLDQRLEGSKAFKGHTDGELNLFGIQHANNVIAEKGAVHARLDDAARQNRLDFPHAGEDERLGAVGVVHVTGTMPDIEDLPGLGDGAKQRVVAALPFLLPIEADSCALGEAASGKNRAVEVQRDAGQPQFAELIQHPLPEKAAQIGDTGLIQPRQRPADGGDIWQALQSQQAAHHGIILVVGHVLEPAVAQQEVDDQQQHDDAVAEDRADRQVTETPGQLLLQPNAGKQGLVDHQSGERGQPLILEFDLGNAVGFTMNSGFATLHANGLRWFSWFVWRHQFYQLRDRFFMPENHFLALVCAVFWTALLVRSSDCRASCGSRYI
jgi:hypothetical protein